MPRQAVGNLMHVDVSKERGGLTFKDWKAKRSTTQHHISQDQNTDVTVAHV
jgi:hypothetical protein